MERISLRKENGVALIIALIMLLILTLIGVSSISTTTFETNISGNERVGTVAFYASEAGFQVGVNQLPDTTLISRKEFGEDSYYSSRFTSFGSHMREGFDSSWTFRRFQVSAIGESFSAKKEIEAQVSYGPFPSGTDYNN